MSSLLDALLLDPAPFEVWVARRNDGLYGSGTLNDPWDASTTARFDDIMANRIAAGTTVHLGPGTFTTAGYTDGPPVTGWQIKARTRIVGSGRDVTTLKLANGSITGAHYFVVGHSLVAGSPSVPNPVDFCEVLDLTLDCDLANQSGSSIACGAVRLMGNHVRIRGLKAKNWGTKSTSVPCLVFAAITGDRTAGLVETVNSGIEDCIAVEPSPFAPTGVNTGPSNALHIGGASPSGANAEAYGKGTFIRNCFVDGGTLPEADRVRGISAGWCRGAIIEGNQIHNVNFGGPYQDHASIGDLIVRGNTYKNLKKGPFFNMGSHNTPAALTLSSLTRDAGDTSNLTALATTNTSDHSFQAGDRVHVTSATAPSQYLGIFVLATVPALNQFTYKMISNPGAGSYTDASARKIFGISNLLVERNVIELAGSASVPGIAVHVQDASAAVGPDYVHTEAIIRNNIIGYLNGAYDASYLEYAIQANGVKNLIVRDNVVECAPANPIRESRCGTAKFFNNKSPSGALIQGHDDDTNLKYSELETEAEDALLLTLF